MSHDYAGTHEDDDIRAKIRAHVDAIEALTYEHSIPDNDDPKYGVAANLARLRDHDLGWIRYHVNEATDGHTRRTP